MSEASNNVVVQVSHLSKRYGNVHAVRDISFNVHKGEVLGFLGPNGAGKTTTMKMLTCFIPADEGNVRVSGFDVRENSLEVRKRIGYLPESAPLYHDMGVIEYLQFVCEMRGIEKAAGARRIGELVDLCGLSSMGNRVIGHLSKGYRQRVGLAQTLLHDPDILIMDEPTVGLDPNQIVEIRQLIKRIGREKTVVLSTHILPEVEATCDRVIIINNGTLVADGTTQELIGKSSNSADKILCKIRGDAQSIERKLGEIGGVETVRKTGEGINQLQHFQLTMNAGADPSEDIFYAVSRNGWSLTELRREGVRLEDVFAQLTQKEEQA